MISQPIFEEDDNLVFNQHAQEFAEIAADGFWKTDGDHRFVFVSSTLSDGGNIPVKMIGKTPWEIEADFGHNRNDLNEVRSHFESHQAFRKCRLERDSASKGTIYLRVSGKPFYHPNGFFAGFRGVTIDETTMVESELNLKNMQN